MSTRTSATTHEPMPFEKAHTLALQALRQGRSGDAAALLNPWLVGPDAPVAALHVAGVAYMKLGQHERAHEALERLTERAPRDVAAWSNLATVQMEMGLPQQALESLSSGLAVDPGQAALHFNRGNVLKRIGNLAGAAASFQKAAELSPGSAEPACNLAAVLVELGQRAQAAQVLELAAQAHPSSAAVWNQLGVLQLEGGQAQAAMRCFFRAMECTPRLAAAHINAARLLAQFGHVVPARKAALYALKLEEKNVEAEETLRALMAGSDAADGSGWLDQADAPSDEDLDAFGLLFDHDARACNWDALDRRLGVLRRLWARGIFAGADVWRMLHHLTDPAEVRMLTEGRYAKAFDRTGAMDSGSFPVAGDGARPQRLRIGYFSGDFHQHAMSVLAAGMYESHDKSRFETIALCLGSYPNGDDVMRQRVRGGFDRFEEVGALDDEALVRFARSLNLDIAVDLTGHTANERMAVFAQRIAPVQIHFMGYAGTLGMPGAIDYLFTDPVLTPPDHHAHFSEKLIALPDTYQVNDRKRSLGGLAPSRQEMGLPSDAFVFCCFNEASKITREVFGVWMELLHAAPHSVLWLRVPHAAARSNLKAAAVGAGIAADRLVFAEDVPFDQHIARHALADLFLDTWPYNAHTTASDALWSGLPVLTLTGQTFPSRVGASLLHACGLPELVTHNVQDYLSKATEFAARPQAVQALRRQLQDTRLQVPLFDTERFTRHIESAYDMAWDRFSRGLPPEHFAVPPRP
jgi:protein O-GlcNAc transferase